MTRLKKFEFLTTGNFYFFVDENTLIKYGNVGANIIIQISK